MRRRRHQRWLWVSLSIAALAIGFSFVAIIRFQINQQAGSTVDVQRGAAYGREAVQSSDSKSQDVSADSETTTSIRTLLDLNRGAQRPGDESTHFRPAVDFRDPIEPIDIPDIPYAPSSDREAMSSDDATELDRTVTVPTPPASDLDPSASVSPGQPGDPAESDEPSVPGSLRYHLSLPPGGSRGAPLILFLHGTGGVRAVWNRWATVAQSRGYIVCMPVASGNGAGDPKSGNRGNDSARRWAEADIAKLCKLSQKLVQSLGADPSRVYLFGYSNGAFFAQETGLRNPQLFSAVVSIGGGCNVFQFPPGAADVGVYMIHGTADRAVPVEVARKSVQRLKNAGISHIVLKEYPDRGHELFEDDMPAVFTWLETRNSGG